VSFTIYVMSFLRLMGLLDCTIQSSIYIPPSNPPQHTPLYRTHRSRPLPTTLVVSDFDNPTIDCDSHILACGFFVLWSESYGSLLPMVFFGLFFSPCFSVFLFLACESKMMSFGRKMLLFMYQIESIWSRPIVTTED
jgi:hypothetical protein